jgi:hypothetical protein
MKKSTVALLHAGYWGCYLLLVTFLYFLSVSTEETESALDEDLFITLVSAVLPGVISFYGFYLRLVPRLLAKRNIQKFLLGGLLVSVIAGLVPTLLFLAVLNQLLPGVPGAGIEVLLEVAPLLLLGFTFVAALNGALSTMIRGFITWYSEIRVREALEKKNLETQLELLKAQLNPHFLFNTLNNIDVLIGSDAPAASRYLNNLSEMLRFMLYASPLERVPLTRELHYIRQYLELQQIRTANAQFVECTITGTANHLGIAPMIFIPFLENAFKYATNKKIPKAISLHFDIGEKEVFFTCRNAYTPQKPIPADGGGLGLKLIRQRLELLYQDRYALNIHSAPDTFTVELRLQLHEPATQETTYATGPVPA